MGFYARVSNESHLFSRLNICKFHLQTVGQSFQHQRPQFYGLPTLKIFWWEIALPSFRRITFLLCTGGGFYKADLQIVKFSPDSFMARNYILSEWELIPSPMISCSEKTPHNPMHHPHDARAARLSPLSKSGKCKSAFELEPWAKRNKHRRQNSEV